MFLLKTKLEHCQLLGALGALRYCFQCLKRHAEAFRVKTEQQSHSNLANIAMENQL